MVRSVIFTLFLVSGTRAAWGEPALFGTAEVTAGGGHDTNMFLPVVGDPATASPLVGGWFGRAAPRLGGALAVSDWRLEAAYALDYRGSDAAGRLLDQRVELGLLAPRLGPLQPGVAASAGRFDPARYGEDRFLFASGELSLRLEITASFRSAASYRAELRRYPARAAGADSDLVHQADLRFAYRPPSRIDVGRGGWYLGIDPVRASLVDNGGLRFLRAGPDLELVFQRLSLGLWGWGGWLDRTGLARLWQVGGGIGGLVRLAENLDAVVTLDWTGSPGSGDPTASPYARRYAALSLVAHVTGRASLAARESGGGLAPAIEPGRVRFRLRAAGASVVRVIGSWDDWEAAGRELAATREPGLWEAWVDLPPGQHRYRFLVDGKPVRAPDATRYVADDFGGEDGVVEVPAASQP